ncbi:MAG: bifunctional oligoribonuclease/PAP phosphatase NrnA, partial [Lachnospiraceae bacterium]|nr:bifunctional oligoribonuclease/PAP phosphatase NrnA [Lachnospiraceae bacterium]
IIDRSYYEKTYTQNQLLGRALLESVRFLEGRAVFTAISRRTLDFYDAKPKDLDGVANQLLLTKGVSCSILLCETGPLEYKVSMRSDDSVDVAAIAVAFGGGGHNRAAGCTMNGNIHDVINSLSKYIEDSLNSTDK